MDQATALTKLTNARKSGAMVYARDEEIQEIHQQYETLITQVNFTKDDFQHVGGNKYYPLKHAQNKIAEACGVSYTDNCGTKERGKFSDLIIVKEGTLFIVRGDYSVIGWAQGTRIKPDGQLRTSSICEYEFSVSDRCNLDFVGKFPPTTIEAARKKLLEVKKFATRRADTGAKLAVIRELAWIPTGFEKEDTLRPMVFSQVIENSDYKHRLLGSLMSTTDGRQSVAQAMLGTKQSLFGPGSKEEAKEEIPQLTNKEKEPEQSKQPVNTDDDKTMSDLLDDHKSVDNVNIIEINRLKDELLDYYAEGEFDNNEETKTRIREVIDDKNISLDKITEIVMYIRKRRSDRPLKEVQG
jgi:hypothetical protein